jgi:hypothetical protein
MPVPSTAGIGFHRIASFDWALTQGPRVPGIAGRETIRILLRILSVSRYRLAFERERYDRRNSSRFAPSRQNEQVIRVADRLGFPLSQSVFNDAHATVGHDVATRAERLAGCVV